MGLFEKQVVLITGASAGIGAALAREYAKQGADLVLTARREERLQTLAKEIKGMGRRALPMVCDVTRQDDLDRAVDATLEHFGRLDVVIANAGFGVVGRFEELSIQDYQRQFETNVYGVMRTLKASLDALQQSRGRFAIIGSVNSHLSLPGNSAYGMSKFAVHALAQSLRHELSIDGVSTTLISPGFVASEIRQVTNHGEYRPDAKESAPGWLIMPAETAARQITRAIHKRKREAVITLHGKIIVWLQRRAPGLVSWLISRAGISARPQPK